jgi:hypothetical protein
MANITVTNTAGQNIVTVGDKTINSTFDTALIGESVEDYMLVINNNFVKLLENFSGDVAPPKASTDAGKVAGQVWYDSANDKINYKTDTAWLSNSTTLSGKTLDGIREYTLAGIDTTGKLSKTGGNVTGEINVNGAVQIQQPMLPSTTDTVSLGGENNRFRNIYLQEDGIRLGDESKGLTFKPHNFVYAVASDETDVSKFPLGAIILHQETGEAIIKKSTGTFGKNNSTFRKLADDKQNSAVIGGNKFSFLGNTGLIAGGYTPSSGYSSASIDKISIPTTSNSSNFGNLTYGRSHMGCGMSNGVRGVFQGGWMGYNTANNGKMDYVTIATPGNATNFGTIGYENYGSSCVSDGTRGVIGPAYNATSTGPSGHHNISNYVTIETPGNASKFGSVAQGYWGTAVSSGTRGVFGGYSRNGWDSVLEYITIQTLGNSTYFGSCTYNYGAHGVPVTDAIKGVIMGGYSRAGWNNIEYFTIATTSNAQQFGKLTGNAYDGAGVSNGIRGVLVGSLWNTTMEYITISTPGNSTFFGSLAQTRSARPSSVSGN